jgi:hypothetical protein
MQAGYSARSLPDKLGIKAGMSVLIINGAESLLDALSSEVKPKLAKSIPKITSKLFDYIHLFATQESSLVQSLPQLKAQLEQSGMIWISWPKKAAIKAAKKIANIDTDLTEDVILGHALAIGLVDVKVCAIDEIWSGLKLVIPVKDRERK